MPLSLASLPDVFNAVIISALSQVYSQNVVSYLDNIVVSVKDPSEMPKILTYLLQRMREIGLKFSLPKVEIFEKRIIALGHVISEKGSHCLQRQ